MCHPLNQSLGSSSLEAAAGTYWPGALHGAYPWWMVHINHLICPMHRAGNSTCVMSRFSIRIKNKGSRREFIFFQKGFPYILRCVEQTQSSPSLPNLMSWAPKKCYIETNASQPSVKTAFSLCSPFPWRKYHAGSLKPQPGPEGPNEAWNTSFCQREHKPNSLAACSCGCSLRAFPCAITSHYILMLL